MDYSWDLTCEEIVTCPTLSRRQSAIEQGTQSVSESYNNHSLLKGEGVYYRH